jgi:hypothetical protein
LNRALLVPPELKNWILLVVNGGDPNPRPPPLFEAITYTLYDELEINTAKVPAQYEMFVTESFTQTIVTPFFHTPMFTGFTPWGTAAVTPRTENIPPVT